MVSFLNHIASILSERVLTCGAVYPFYISRHVRPVDLFLNNFLLLMKSCPAAFLCMANFISPYLNPILSRKGPQNTQPSIQGLSKFLSPTFFDKAAIILKIFVSKSFSNCYFTYIAHVCLFDLQICQQFLATPPSHPGCS